jgi:hypothetical protein
MHNSNYKIMKTLKIEIHNDNTENSGYYKIWFKVNNILHSI